MVGFSPKSSVSSDEAFGGYPLSVGVQSILFENDFGSVDRSIGALARAAELAVLGGSCTRVTIQFGDSSPSPCISNEQWQILINRYCGIVNVTYDFFADNLGSARGHNRIAKANSADILLVQNPNVIVSPRLIEIMLEVFRVAGVGVVEAKQVPIEHPKDYNAETGETSWASTACTMIPRSLFNHLGGFDADTFFLYCDDVDFSWRARLAGFKVIFQPAAVAFHDKRLADDGSWQPSSAERYYSAEAALLLSYKWSRLDITKKCLSQFEQSGLDYLLQAANTYKTRSSQGFLPTQLDHKRTVSQFIDGMYAAHRFPL
jgi:GT2 family glycosyltransferase